MAKSPPLKNVGQRPWGRWIVIDEGPGYKVKKIIVKPGERLSLQKHHYRSEHWTVIEGRAKILCGKIIFRKKRNQSCYVPAGTKHRLENSGKNSLIVIEVQVGAYLGEDDIVRFDDDYGRIAKSGKQPPRAK
ncbi:MAG: phosphomannose isomerase type II C-terminal cupin domain [Elusimicrobia bacterium]|nr:phosphomannose isomerase type II C-terminal cupin domain [Elusimicrobiota bacterium]